MLAAGAVGLSLCWGAPALASDEPTCPIAVEFERFEPVSAEALKERAAITRLMTAIKAPYFAPLYTGMNSAQFVEAADTAKLIHSEYLAAQGEWVAASNGATDDIAACKKLTDDIATLRKTSASMSPGGDITELNKVIEVKAAKLKKVIEEANKKVTIAKDAYTAFTPRRDFLVAFASRFPKPEEIAQQQGSKAPQLVQAPKYDGEECLIDNKEQRRRLNPNECKFLSQDVAAFISPPTFSSAIGDVPIAGQPVDKRGITVSITGAKDSSDLSLSLTDTFRLRTPWTQPGDEFQRLTSWGYKVGVSTGGKNGNLLDFNERDEKDRLTNQFDRLDAKTKLSLSLFYADYDNEKVTEFDARSAKFYKAARDACIAAQGKPDAFPSSCDGQPLMAWIFAQKDGAYLHDDHATAFGSLYFAPPPSVKYAKWGMGVSVDIARPAFAFKDLPAGAPTTELLAAKLIDERKLTFTIAPYAFVRLLDSKRFGATLIPSVTLKREYGTEDAVTVCPPTTLGQPFSLSCGDAFLPERPDRKTYLIPSMEGRLIWSGARLGRFYFPQFALAPKSSYDTDAERWEFTAPAYFAVDSSKSLTAGLSLIHRTGGKNDVGDKRKDETGVAIVVGKTFSLDPSF